MSNIQKFALVTVLIILAGSGVVTSLNTPIVQLDQNGHCVQVLGEGTCSNLPTKYSVEHVWSAK